ncbi:MAG TPA: ornithine cyclodeaminase family protein [Firmicutes bacterium]|nr:ornithine cyclodeaminase family protein [Candidatus Fermentithermobacillaceae bacterium]
MRIIDKTQVEQSLDMRRCIGLMRDALIALSNGDAKQIVRPVLPLYGQNVLGMMPAYMASRKVAGVKVLAVFPENYRKGIPSHQGQMLVFESETGCLKAIVDAESLTGIRTAAVSAAATDVLARPDASRLAILGAGLQGRRHLEALRLIRELQEVTVWDIRHEAAARYADEMSRKTGLPVRACSSAKEATSDADIICTLTPSREPILSAADVKPGTHINAVGACSPNAREISSDLMALGRLYVDWKPAVLAEAGDYLLAVRDGAITEAHILGEIGQLLSGRLPGREKDTDVTIFEALGQAIEDLIVADFVADYVAETLG